MALVAVVHIVRIASTHPALCFKGPARACVNCLIQHHSVTARSIMLDLSDHSDHFPRGSEVIYLSFFQSSISTMPAKLFWCNGVGKLLTINYYPCNGEGNGTGAAVGAVLQRRVKAGDWGVEASLWWLGWWCQWYWRHHWWHHQGFAARKDRRTVSNNNVHV